MSIDQKVQELLNLKAGDILVNLHGDVVYKVLSVKGSIENDMNTEVELSVGEKSAKKITVIAKSLAVSIAMNAYKILTTDQIAKAEGILSSVKLGDKLVSVTDDDPLTITRISDGMLGVKHVTLGAAVIPAAVIVRMTAAGFVTVEPVEVEVASKPNAKVDSDHYTCDFTKPMWFSQSEGEVVSVDPEDIIVVRKNQVCFIDREHDSLRDAMAADFTNKTSSEESMDFLTFAQILQEKCDDKLHVAFFFRNSGLLKEDVDFTEVLKEFDWL